MILGGRPCAGVAVGPFKPKQMVKERARTQSHALPARHNLPISTCFGLYHQDKRLCVLLGAVHKFTMKPSRAPFNLKRLEAGMPYDLFKSVTLQLLESPTRYGLQVASGNAKSSDLCPACEWTRHPLNHECNPCLCNSGAPIAGTWLCSCSAIPSFAPPYFDRTPPRVRHACKSPSSPMHTWPLAQAVGPFPSGLCLCRAT